MAEKVKRLHDDFQRSMLANLEELQHTQRELHLTCRNEGVAGPKPRERGDDGDAPLWLASKPVVLTTHRHILTALTLNRGLTLRRRAEVGLWF